VSNIGLSKLNQKCFVDKFVSHLLVGFMDQACFAY